MKKTQKKTAMALAGIFMAASMLAPNVTYAQQVKASPGHWGVILNTLQQIKPVHEGLVDSFLTFNRWSTRYQNNTTVAVPVFANPMDSVAKDAFESEVISDRLAAYKQVLAAGDMERSHYIDIIEDYYKDRDLAYSNQMGIEKIHTTYTRFEKWIRTKDDSYAGDAFGGKLSERVLYKPEEIHKVLEAEVKASSDLFERYDKAISQMQQNLAEYDRFALELRTEYARDIWRGQSAIAAEMTEADKILAEINGAPITPASSAGAMNIADIQQKMATETGIALAQADELIKKGIEKDNAAARRGRLQSFLQLASAAASFAGSIDIKNQPTQPKPTQTSVPVPAGGMMRFHMMEIFLPPESQPNSILIESTTTPLPQKTFVPKAP